MEALRDEPVRVLLTSPTPTTAPSCRRGTTSASSAPSPHAPVLERAAAVVWHSGMGIVQKAIAAGVPIAAVPFGRDQPEVARRVVEAGAGVELRIKDLGPERLRATVREALAMRPPPRSPRRACGARWLARFADAVRSSRTATGTGRRTVLGIVPLHEETPMSRFAHVNLFDVEDSVSGRVARSGHQPLPLRAHGSPPPT